ncbi:MAG: hypothetical protein E7163_04630 [Firmicutes bacterium]|nr:hypothetical protein [Bacillota bacterium]
MFQNPALKELVNKYREKKLAHAYLIETNNLSSAISDIKELIKILNCGIEYKENCTNCNLCNLINKNILPSLKIIEPDGSSIKKAQIEELKENFSSIPIYTKYNIYIISNAEKLNSSSANSMLKFVEEPTEGIIGFFVTTNKDVMIDTIKSRCQSIVLNYETKSLIEELNLTNEEYEKYIETIKRYLEKVNNSNIINNKKEILSIYSERKDVENLLKIIFNIYYQTFLKKLNKDYNEEIVNTYEIKDSLKELSIKLNIITKILQEMSYNVSTELILDKFVIEMRGSHE